MRWLAVGVLVVISIRLLTIMVWLHRLHVLLINSEVVDRDKVLSILTTAVRWFGVWVMLVGVLLASMGQWVTAIGPIGVGLVEAGAIPWIVKQSKVR